MDNKNIKFILIVSILCSVFAISVSYATFSQTVAINGTATVASENWSIYFDNLENTIIVGNAKEIVKPTLTNGSTALGTFDVEFFTQGDLVKYEFDVVNDGTFDAILTTLDKAIPVCIGTGIDSVANANYVCSHIEYNLSYSDGTLVAENDILLAGEVKNLVLEVTYTGTNTPVNPVDITGLDIDILYVQN